MAIAVHKVAPYSFTMQGEKPLPLLKNKMEIFRQTEQNHPVLNAKGAELISIPQGKDIWEYINEFVGTIALPNKVYIAILKLGAVEIEYIDSEEMTGKCNVKDNIVKGARKWDTKHVVYHAEQIKDTAGGYLYDENANPVTRNVELGLFDTKGEAMSFAKQQAMDSDCEVFVELEKRLDGTSNRVADISPIKRKVKQVHERTVNEFLYFGRNE
jgi:hypothetical protein